MSRHALAALLLGAAACGEDDQREVGLADTSQPVIENRPADTAAGAPASARQPRSNRASERASKETVDREAVAALDRMGGYLRSLKSFQVKAAMTRDEVLTSGQKVQLPAPPICWFEGRTACAPR